MINKVLIDNGGVKLTTVDECMWVYKEMGIGERNMDLEGKW